MKSIKLINNLLEDYLKDHKWPKNIYILGGGNLAREVNCYLKDFLEVINLNIPNIYYIDTTLQKSVLAIDGVRILCEFPHEGVFVVGVGSPKLKELLVNQAIKAGMTPFMPIAHPNITTGDYFKIGEGSIITPHCGISTNVSIGKFVFINLKISVGHDTIIGDYTTINPGCNISGNINIGHHIEIGTGASLINGILVAPYNYIGAGAVVSKSFEEENTLIVGVPAIVKKRNYEF